MKLIEAVGHIKYRCRKCNKEWAVYIPEGNKDKQFPDIISCTKCHAPVEKASGIINYSVNHTFNEMFISYFKEELNGKMIVISR